MSWNGPETSDELLFSTNDGGRSISMLDNCMPRLHINHTCHEIRLAVSQLQFGQSISCFNESNIEVRAPSFALVNGLRHSIACSQTRLLLKQLSVSYLILHMFEYET